MNVECSLKSVSPTLIASSNSTLFKNITRLAFYEIYGYIINITIMDIKHESVDFRDCSEYYVA